METDLRRHTGHLLSYRWEREKLRGLAIAAYVSTVRTEDELCGRSRRVCRRHFRDLLSLALGDAAAQRAWHTMTGQDASFTVELPQAPECQTMQSASGAGTSCTTHIYGASNLDGDRTFMVSTAVLPGDVDVSNPRRRLQAGLDAAATRIEGGKHASVDWKQHQGLTAFDAVGRTRSGRDIRTFGVTKGSRLITLTYVGVPGSAASADVNRFIASLRIR